MPDATEPLRYLNVELVQDALADSAFATVAYALQTGSTNDDAQKVLGRPEVAGTTFVAEEQTAGRGRRAGRSWIAAPGTALTFTTILPTTVATADLWAVPFWTALAVADGIQRAAAGRIELRWPNDGFVAGGKVLGILCISRVAGDRAHVACGVGLNVFRPPEKLAIEPPPAFLSDVTRVRLERETILVEILNAFDRRLPALTSAATVARTYTERAELDGARYAVRYDLDGRVLEGITRGLGPDGALRLEADGVEHLIALGDARRL